MKAKNYVWILCSVLFFGGCSNVNILNSDKPGSSDVSENVNKEDLEKPKIEKPNEENPTIQLTNRILSVPWRKQENSTYNTLATVQMALLHNGISLSQFELAEELSMDESGYVSGDAIVRVMNQYVFNNPTSTLEPNEPGYRVQDVRQKDDYTVFVNRVLQDLDYQSGDPVFVSVNYKSLHLDRMSQGYLLIVGYGRYSGNGELACFYCLDPFDKEELFTVAPELLWAAIHQSETPIYIW